MKKKLLGALMALVMTAALALPVGAYQDFGLFYDDTDLIDSYNAEIYGDTLQELSDLYGVQVRVDVVTDLEGETIEDYAYTFYDIYGYGYGATRDCVLLMICLTDIGDDLYFEDYAVICAGDSEGFLVSLVDTLDDELDAYLNDDAFSGDLTADNDIFLEAMSTYITYADEYLSDVEFPMESAEEEEPAEEPAAVESPDYLPFVNDYAMLLSGDEAADLEEKATALADEYGCGVYILTVDDYWDYGTTPELAAEGYFTDYGLGLGDDANGIMLMLSMDDRDYWLLGHGDIANTAMTDYGRELMEEQFLDNFGDDDWYGGFCDYMDVAEDYLEEAAYGTPVDVGGDYDSDSSGSYSGSSIYLEDVLASYGIALLVGLIFAIVFCTILKGQMKSAQKATAAREYIIPGGVNITYRHDQYTHTTRTERRIRDDDDHGGTSVDSGGFSGSGGKF